MKPTSSKYERLFFKDILKVFLLKVFILIAISFAYKSLTTKPHLTFESIKDKMIFNS
jgi:hypothetical protein